MSRTGRPLAMPVEHRKKEIHAVAEQLFGERGYEKVTMSEIAVAAGMSKKTLYVHFADKQALLKSLVESSLIWPESRTDASQAVLPSGELVAALKAVAAHVLSERHLRLCRLAIGESISITGLADTFYEMGIQRSRDSLIGVVDRIEPARRKLGLESAVLADMLFGATIGKVLIDALLTAERPDLPTIHASIEQVVAAMFSEAPSRPQLSHDAGGLNQARGQTRSEG